MDAEKQAEIAAKVKAVIAANAALQAENEALKAELDTCINTVNNIFGKLMNKRGQLDMSKAMSLISNPGKLENDISELMIILEKYGKAG